MTDERGVAWSWWGKCAAAHIVAVVCVLAIDVRAVRAAPPRARSAPQPSAAKPADGDRPVARYRVHDGSTIDLGWTGIAHRQPWSTEQRIEFALDCGDDGICAVHGGAEGVIFGAPIPLAAGGIPACVVSRLRAPLSGTVGAKTGCGDLRLALSSSVYTAGDVARPCPTCVGDSAPNDGRKHGRCEGGASAGKQCDVNGTSTVFGATSNDCLPPADAAAGTVAIDLAPLTTGTVRVAAEHDCKRRDARVSARCFCAGQLQPNECDAATCGAGESCDAPVDGVCSRARYRACRPGTGAADCAALVAGSGTCENRIRQCFGDTIEATGVCDVAAPTYVAIFCAGSTRSAAINSSTGLPGPARLRLRLERIPDAPHAASSTKSSPTRH